MNTLALEKSVSFAKILVATDFSEASKQALACATSIAGANQGELFVVHAIPGDARLPVPLDPLPAGLDRPRSEAQQQMAELVSKKSPSGVPREGIVERGTVREVVMEMVQQKGIDLLVIGTHGRKGFKKLVLGSMAEELFRGSACPVLTVGPSSAPPRKIQRVLFATDFGPSSVRALPYAIDFANKASGELILLHLVCPVPVAYTGPSWYPAEEIIRTEENDKQKSLKRLRDLLPSDCGLKCSVEHVAEVHLPAEGILSFASQRHVDLIVMGIRESAMSGPRLASHLPWDVAYEVVCGAECPVLTVRS